MKNLISDRIWLLLALSTLCLVKFEVTAQQTDRTNQVVRSFGLSAQQTVQIREASKGVEMSDLLNKLEAAQKDALRVALQENSNDDVIQQKIETVAKIQLQIAVLRYKKGVKPVLTSISEEQKSQMLEAPGFAYGQLFVGSGAGTGSVRGGRFSPQQQ